MQNQLIRGAGRLRAAVVSAVCAAVAALLVATIVPAAASISLAAGQTVHAVLSSQDINTKNASVGDRFTMRVEPPYPGGRASLSGATVFGHVSAVRRAGQGRKALLTLAFDSIRLPDGQSAPIAGTVTQLDAKSENTTARKALGAGVGMAVGSQTVGRILGGTLGRVVGTLGGAAAGYAYANNSKANFNVAKGAKITIQTTTTTLIEHRQA